MEFPIEEVQELDKLREYVDERLQKLSFALIEKEDLQNLCAGKNLEDTIRRVTHTVANAYPIEDRYYEGRLIYVTHQILGDPEYGRTNCGFSTALASRILLDLGVVSGDNIKLHYKPMKGIETHTAIFVEGEEFNFSIEFGGWKANGYKITRIRKDEPCAYELFTADSMGIFEMDLIFMIADYKEWLDSQREGN